MGGREAIAGDRESKGVTQVEAGGQVMGGGGGCVIDEGKASERAGICGFAWFNVVRCG